MLLERSADPTREAVDRRAPLMALRAELNLLRAQPGLPALQRLAQAVEHLPEGSNGRSEDAYCQALRAIDSAIDETPEHFTRIARGMDHVRELASTPPSWISPSRGEAAAQVVQLLAMCHTREPDMERRPYSPWTRAAEAGTRLFTLMQRRTEARPAHAALLRAAEEFGTRLRAGLVRDVDVHAEWLALLYTEQMGLFPISTREALGEDWAVVWRRKLGTRVFRFELTLPDAQEPDAPHGRVVVRAPGGQVRHSFPLTSRTRRVDLNRFINAL
ncbi:hypothetical protein [Streptomyces smyrnaeus]|uniref:hypothetical protein n=1 Tax=Streptomyces smyrnaeus TaxID=1387713 RepID=UPI000C186B08